MLNINVSELIQLILKSEKINDFGVVFLSVLIEAFPFILIGTFVSAIIQVLVSDKTIAKIIPKNKFVGLIIASLMGFVFPVCECTIVPIVRRLIKKGVPLHIAITFMLAVPIVNPVVLLSTYYAFSGKWEMVIMRGVLGMFGAMAIGYIVDLITDKNNIFKEKPIKKQLIDVEKEDYTTDKSSIIEKIFLIVKTACQELYDIGRFLIIGAFLSSLVQIFVPKTFLFSLGQNNVSSILALMGMTFVLSLCSEVDAFIARTMVSQFTNGSIVGFLIFGPMIDIKNTIMLSGSFKSKFVFKLIVTIAVVCFLLAYLINIF